ncbi:MAG: DUF4385 domain-containing protein [Ferruginibacter sp.]|nr:DUF4385 domain-containing protein [Cytophagales bacterium]
MADNFDYALDFRQVDFRAHPECYRVGKGEQGVLVVEPYKSEILPHWRFKDPATARQSSETIHGLFLDYLAKSDFVGADMARKFLQMGYTRARRYANHRSGRKYASNPQRETTPEAERQKRHEAQLPLDPDPVKAAAAELFREKWILARQNPDYLDQMQRHRAAHESNAPRNETSALAYFNQRRQKEEMAKNKG